MTDNPNVDPEGIDVETCLAQLRDHLNETAATLAYIAKAAADIAAQDRPIPLDDLDAAGTGLRTTPPGDLIREYVPQAVNGVRFTADLVGHYSGIVGGRTWLHMGGYGFLDITDSTAPGNRNGYWLTGRVVSATPDHALCITDGGRSVTLPRALITEGPDE